MTDTDTEPVRSYWPSTCPRCGIAHADAPPRHRRDALCGDCRGYGPAWRQQARREVQALQQATTFRCGHPKTDANTYRRPDGRSPECLTCKHKHRRRHERQHRRAS